MLKFVKWCVIFIGITYGIVMIMIASFFKLGVGIIVIASLGVIFLVSLLIRDILIGCKIIKPHKKRKYSKIKRSKASPRFKEIYNLIEAKYGKELEKNRINAIISPIVFGILFLISVPLFLLLGGFLLEKIGNGSGVVFSGIICFCISFSGLYYYVKSSSTYKENFKKNVIKNLLEYINPYLKYNPEGDQSIAVDYKNANFNNEEFSNIIIDDYISGKDNNDVKVEMANILVRNNKNEDIYEGIFSVTKINAFLKDEVKITKNKFIINKDINNVLMDSQEFEKYFDVSSNSEILAMQVLTHDIMMDLVDFFTTYKIEFEMTIKENNIYIRFDTGAMFEPNIFKKSYDKTTLWIYYSILNFVTNFTIKINKVLKDIPV